MQLNGKEINVRITGKTLIEYKQVFKKDMFSAIKDMNEEMTNIFELVYVIAKCNDADFSNEYPTYDSFMENANLGDVLNEDALSELTKEMERSMSPTKTVKKKVTAK